jgi:DNA polymerase III delta prime subunit
MPDKPIVFISYTQADDDFEDGTLGRLRDNLSKMLRFLSGGTVAIFEAEVDIEIGQPIQQRISQSLQEALILVPMLTPDYFRDKTCKDVLTRFLDREKELGRNDLVLPIYYQRVPHLASLTANDPHLNDVIQRRAVDWQPLRGKKFNDVQVRNELERIARRIIDILSELKITKENPRSQEIAIQSSKLSWQEKQRRLDAAMPAEAKIGVPTEVWAQICILGSRGFRSELPQYTEFGDEITRQDVQQEKFVMNFPRDSDTGQLTTMIVRLQVRAHDFQIDNPVQDIIVSPHHNSGKAIFSLMPIHNASKSRVYVDALQITPDNKNISLGTVPLSIQIYPADVNIPVQISWKLMSLLLNTNAVIGATRQCPNCQYSCLDTAKFCRNCGQSLTEVNSAQTQSNQPEQHSPEDQYNPARTIHAGSNVTQVGGDIVGGHKAGGDIVGGDKVTYNYHVAAPETAREHRNRAAMLTKVRTYWIEGFLRQSLHKVAILNLGMRYDPDAVELPWEGLVQQPDRSDTSVPSGTTIVDLFEQSGGALLILGMPGTGKTTMLLELTRALLERAQKDETYPIPVVFNLSSWAEKRPPLTTWLITELNTRYDVPRKVARAWLANDQVLPLLDGLDEVRPAVRNDCIETINAFRKEHGMVGIAVCSRTADYQVLTQKLRLQGAVKLQPLTDRQIDAVLRQTSDTTATIHNVWQQLQKNAQQHNDPDAQALLYTPLMLNIIMLAYQGVSSATLPTQAAPAEQYRYLFATYVQRMFRRRGVSQGYSQEQTTRWLAWLAERMEQHNQSIFFIEQISKDWLSNSRQRIIYGLIVGCISGIFCGTLIGLLIFPIWGAIGTGIAGAVTGLALGGGIGVDSWRRGSIEPVETITWRWSQLMDSKKTFILFGAFIGLIASLLGIAVGALIAPLQGLLTFIIISMGLLVLLLSLMGLSRGNELPHTSYPNERIWRSLRTFGAVVAGCTLGGGLILGVVGILLGRLLGNWDTAFQAGITAGATGAWIGILSGLLFGGLFFGGLACLQHGILRLLLTRNRFVPWNYAYFLDYATERVFLHRIGGGYIFVHRMLMEYFASLETEDATTPKKNNHTSPGDTHA